MPRSRSQRDMTLLQAILDTEGFGEGEHPGSDSTLNTTSSGASNPRAPRTDPRSDPLDLALQQKHRELQLLLWQQHVERQVLMQRQMLQQQVMMQRSSYTHRRGKRGRQLRGPVHIPVGSIPPPGQPHHPVVTAHVLTQIQKPQTKVESSTQTVETATSAPKGKEDKTEENKRRESPKSRKEQGQDRQKERRSNRRDKETSVKHKSEEDKTRKSSEQDNKAHRRKGKKEILREEPAPEGHTKVRSRQEDKGQVKETRSLRMSEGEEKTRDDSDSEKRDHKATGHRHGDDLGNQLGVGEDGDHHGNKGHHHGSKGHHHGNGNLHGDSSIKEEKPHKDHDDHREVKGHLHGNGHDSDLPSDVSDWASDSERSDGSYSDSFSSSQESTGSRSGKGSQKSGSDEGMTKRVTFAEEGRREEKKDQMKESPEETPAEEKEVKEKRKKPRQQTVGRKRTATHPQFTITSLSSRYLSLVSSLLELRLNPQYPGKERARTLSSPGRNISEEILKKRAREERKKKRMEKKLEEEMAASPREKQPFQPSDHDLKNSSSPQIQEWLDRKQVEQRKQRREERAKRRLKFQMKMEERDLKIARMLESDEKVDQWMREKRKLLRRKSQKPRKTVVRPSAVQQVQTEETTPLSNSNQGQPDLPTLEKQAAQLEEKLLADLSAEKGQGDAGSTNGKGQGDVGSTNGKGQGDVGSTNGKGLGSTGSTNGKGQGDAGSTNGNSKGQRDTGLTNGKVGNSTTSPADGKVAGMDDFARRTVPVSRARAGNGAQTAGKVPSRPVTAPPRSSSPTKRRGKSLHPMSARSRGSKTSPESSATAPRGVGSAAGSPREPRGVGSASGSPRDAMRTLSYDQWLVQKRREDQQRREQVQKEEADPELQSIIPELGRRRVERAAGRQKLDTGLKQRRKDSGKEKPADSQDNKPRFVWRLRDDPTLERPTTTRPGSRSPSPGKKSPVRPASPLKEPAFYRRQRFSREKMQLFSQSMDGERPEPQGSDCPDITMHDSNGQSDSSLHTADQSEKGTTEAVVNQSEKGTTEAVVDQSEKGTTEVQVIDQPEGTTVNQSESAAVKADSQSLNKASSDQSAPASNKAGQSVNSLFAALGISDEIEENIESESESESEENSHGLSSSQTFLTTVGDTGELG